ncbi:hypothetical protein ABE438_03825 [Bosea sp. TWI1241]|uniref:hypothetical protein n=1 Tax=Bosea sp. TWI1241 TaxID=3148904 RepID=UPI00320AEF8B
MQLGFLLQRPRRVSVLAILVVFAALLLGTMAALAALAPSSCRVPAPGLWQAGDLANAGACSASPSTPAPSTP